MRDLACPSCGVSDWTTGTQALVRGPADEIELRCGGCRCVITVRYERRGPGLLDLLRDRRAGRLEGEAEDETR